MENNPKDKCAWPTPWGTCEAYRHEHYPSSQHQFVEPQPPALPSREEIEAALAEQHPYAAMNYRDEVDDRCTACWRQERDPIHGNPSDAVLALLPSQPTQVTDEMVDTAYDAFSFDIQRQTADNKQRDGWGHASQPKAMRAALEALFGALKEVDTPSREPVQHDFQDDI